MRASFGGALYYFICLNTLFSEKIESCLIPIKYTYKMNLISKRLVDLYINSNFSLIGLSILLRYWRKENESHGGITKIHFI